MTASYLYLAVSYKITSIVVGVHGLGRLAVKGRFCIEIVLQVANLSFIVQKFIC